jgi:mono/diheme cytochrome c family protein
MRRSASVATVAMLAVVPALYARAQDTVLRGDPQKGRQLALEACVSCHIVAADQDIKPLVPNYGPSFFAVANKPGTTAQSLSGFLAHQHRLANMPAPQLTAPQIADVTSYILTLRHRN